MEEKYRHLVTDGYDFDMGKYISQGWDLFKKGAGSYIGFILLYFIFSIVISLIPFINFFSSFILQPLMAGIFVFSRKLLRQEEEFGNFFEGYKFFGNIAIYLLLMIVIMIPVIAMLFGALIPFELLPDLINSDPNNMQYLIEDLAVSFAARIPIVLLIVLISVYIGVSYSIVLPLIVDGQLAPWKAMETSRRIVSKKFFSFFGMFILIGLGAGIGVVITCGLGLLVIMPFIYCIIFSAYDDIFKPDVEAVVNQIDEFGQTDSDTNTEAEES